MDIDQLKLIMETVKGVSGNAQTVAIYWIVVDKLLPLLCWMTVFGVLVCRIPRFVNVLSPFSGSNKFIAWARDELGTGAGGCLADHERERTEQRLRELVIASKNTGS